MLSRPVFCDNRSVRSDAGLAAVFDELGIAQDLLELLAGPEPGRHPFYRTLSYYLYGKYHWKLLSFCGKLEVSFFVRLTHSQKVDRFCKVLGLNWLLVNQLPVKERSLRSG